MSISQVMINSYLARFLPTASTVVFAPTSLYPHEVQQSKGIRLDTKLEVNPKGFPIQTSRLLVSSWESAAAEG